MKFMFVRVRHGLYKKFLVQTLVRETFPRKANFYFLEIRPLERTVHCWKCPMYCNFVHCIKPFLTQFKSFKLHDRHNSVVVHCRLSLVAIFASCTDKKEKQYFPHM